MQLAGNAGSASFAGSASSAGIAGNMALLACWLASLLYCCLAVLLAL